MADGSRPYFPVLIVDGQPVGFAHLEPLRLSMATQARSNGLVIDVRFSSHCFSEKFDPALHAEPLVEVMDGGRNRVFDAVRYGLSQALPGIVLGLPQAHVYQTPETNFVRITARSDGVQGDYRMFFSLKRAAAGQDHDLKMFVESAYGPEPAAVLPTAHMSKVRFTVLVDTTLKGGKVKFHRRR